MGAKQRAQDRGKKAAKGSMKGQPMSQKQLNQSILVPDLNPSSRAKSLLSSQAGAHHGFSMSEEARNTDRRAATWGASSFRTQAISFVSAGPLKREEDAWNTVSEEETPQRLSETEAPLNGIGELHDTSDVSQPTAPDIHDSQLEPTEPAAVPHVQVLQHPEPDPEPRTVSPPEINTSTPSIQHVESVPSPPSDSEEEIVFTGRQGTSKNSTTIPTPIPPADSDPVLNVPEESTGQEIPAAISANDYANDTASVSNTKTTLGNTASLGEEMPGSLEAHPSKDMPINPSLFRRYDEAALMQDYIDNMALDDSDEDENEDGPASGSTRKKFKKRKTFRMFNGNGLENEKVQLARRVGKNSVSHLPNQAFDWDSDDLADFDDLSTTDEEIDDIGQVIRQRTRNTGDQYLVVAVGADANDAKWILHSKLTSESATKEIKIFEDIQQMQIQEDEYDEDDDSEDDDDDTDEEALQDVIEDIESEDDENARIMKHTARMTDEQIARVLAKQEELGIGGDELLLFDGEAMEDLNEDEFGANDDFVPFSLSKHTSNRGRSKRNKKQRDSFPSAEAFADALDQDPYGAFDIMDFERPSLRPKMKGRKSDFPWDIGEVDDETRHHLMSTWTKDREKKAERKRQREEARLVASLDAADNGDPSIIKSRIRQFLVQDVDVLKLSPMESNVRAAVHRLAKSLKLSSRSEGKEGIGIGRYPVLTKTPRTPSYTFETIYEVDALLNSGKFFHKGMARMRWKTPHSNGVVRPGRGGGGGVMSGVTYRDGEEVGASAPEIGADNKGRAMLEKMGWSVGMGIGAEGNKGSLDHVRHIVKTSKAGLG